MDKSEILQKITEKKEFSQLPKKDLLRAFEKFDLEKYSDEEKMKLTRDFLRKTFSGFSGQKLLVSKDKEADEVLKKHLSTRERYAHYKEVYERILKNLSDKIGIIDLGCGTNGFSYPFFEEIGKKVDYVGVEAVGQLADLSNNFFKKEKLSKKAKVIHESLFETEKIKKIVKKAEKPRVIFLFKVVDSLEKSERNYTKTLLKEIVPLADKVIVSFATKSWVRRKKFFANRKWLIDFIRENFQYMDDFEISGERYLVFEKQN